MRTIDKYLNRINEALEFCLIIDEYLNMLFIDNSLKYFFAQDVDTTFRYIL
jgi:hypothetical protein